MKAALTLTLCALLWLGGCGDSDPEDMPFMKKGVPELEFRYQGRTLTAWRSISLDAPAEERAAAAWALTELGGDPAESLPLLLDLLADPDPSVQLAAAVATGRLAPASPEAARRLVALLGAPQEGVRRHARTALGQLGPSALEALSAALTHESPRVVFGALSALGAVGEPAEALVDRVAEIARTTEVAGVRRKALFALPRLGPRGIGPVIEALRSGDLARREEAAAALVRGGEAVVRPVAALLKDEDEVLAARAADVLCDLGTRAAPAMDALFEALVRAGPVRFRSAEALIAIGPPAVPRLESLAGSPDEGLAAIARYALERMQGD